MTRVSLTRCVKITRPKASDSPDASLPIKLRAW
jgi:hypothetical protein